MEGATRVSSGLRERVQKAVWTGLAGLLVAALLSSCGGESPPAPTEPPTPANTPTPAEATTEEKVLTILYWQAPTLPGSYLSAGTKDVDAGAITLEPLAKYDPDGNIVPALAAQVPTLENGGFSQDLMSITWKLKEGLKWSDGSDMTAEDVAFSWIYCVDEETGCTSESSFDGIASVQTLDDLTVKITFEAPTPYPYQAFVGAGTPIISRAQFADCIGAAATACDAQNMAPLGTGPYRIVGFKTNEGGRLRAQPVLPGPETPYFDRVVLKGGGDAISAARTVLERGEADYAWNTQVEPEVLARDGSGRTGHSGRRLHQPGGAYRRQSDQSGPGAGRRPLRVSGWTKSASIPGLQSHSPSYVDGHRPQPHIGVSLRFCWGAHMQSGHWPSELCFDRQRWMSDSRTSREPISCWTIAMSSIPTETASVSTTAFLCESPIRPRPMPFRQDTQALDSRLVASDRNRDGADTARRQRLLRRGSRG